MERERDIDFGKLFFVYLSSLLVELGSLARMSLCVVDSVLLNVCLLNSPLDFDTSAWPRWFLFYHAVFPRVPCVSRIRSSIPQAPEIQKSPPIPTSLQAISIAAQTI